MGPDMPRLWRRALTCLDKDNADFGDEREFQDADGILVAVRYIEKVSSHLSALSENIKAHNSQILMQLNNICI
jgi:hypothetical protein